MSLTLGAPPCEATQATLLSRLVGEGDCLDRKRHPDASALSSHAEGEAASTDMFRDMLGRTSMMGNREQPRLVSLVVPLLAKSKLTLTVPQHGRANMLHAHTRTLRSVLGRLAAGAGGDEQQRSTTGALSRLIVGVPPAWKRSQLSAAAAGKRDGTDRSYAAGRATLEVAATQQRRAKT